MRSCTAPARPMTRSSWACARMATAIVFEVRDAAGREPSSEDWVKRVGEGGRGLELISLMMDEVQLTRGDGGSVLRFSKSLAA